MPTNVDFDAVGAMRQITLIVKIHREKEMRFRLWLATRLIILAALIAGMGIEFEGMKEVD